MPPSPRQPLGAFAFALTLALATSFAATGCRREEPATPPPGEERQLVVFAATSLRDAFTTLGEDFRRAHPGVALTFNFAGTQDLRAQLEHGAAVDVFASADRRHMEALREAGRVETPSVFARNAPVLIVSREAAQRVTGLQTLPDAARIVLGAAEVPIGRYTNALLERALGRYGSDFRRRVEAKVVSRELNVRQVLTKVRLGEAEAGIVYRTDARGVPEVTLVEIPEELNVLAEYPIAVVQRAPSPKLAAAFVALVRSPRGGAVLEEAGFLPPEGTGE